MNSIKLASLAAALLAGTAFVSIPALSQESEPAQSQQPILPQQDQQNDTSVQSEGSAGAATDQGDAGETNAGADADAGQPSNQSARDQAPVEETQPNEANTGTEEAPDQMQNSGETDSAEEAAPGQTEQDDQARTESPSGETTASIDISEEQQTEICNVIVESGVEPADVDIDVSVGVAVPETVELHPLPPRIVEIVPEYDGYVYFVLANGEIVIVDLDSHEIVYVIVT